MGTTPESSIQTAVSLHDVPEQFCGRVLAVRTDTHTRGMLEGLGICEGRLVRLIRRGESYIVSVYGTRVGLAAGLAGAIMVGAADPEG